MNTLKEITIGVAGLGLIGGSIAKAFSSKNIQVTAFDLDQDTVEAAKRDNVISEMSGSNLACLYNCDVIFLCLPVEHIPKVAVKLSENSKALLTDVGSTKKKLLDKIREAGLNRFIGGHPMAGSERVGYRASSEQLLENAIYVLCPDKNTSPEDLQLLKGLVERIGAIPIIMDEEEHDKAVAIVSHLPHIIATSLCQLVDKRKDNMLNALCAGGFRDITRIASSNPELWTEIVLNSKESLLPILEDYINELKGWKSSLEHEDKELILKCFTEGSEFRNLISISGRGILQALPEIKVEVSDKPGAIAGVTSVLAKNNINIQNLNIQNNRVYEGGIMRLTLQEASDKPKALSLLRDQGFVCSE